MKATTPTPERRAFVTIYARTTLKDGREANTTDILKAIPLTGIRRAAEKHGLLVTGAVYGFGDDVTAALPESNRR